jgi:hypothetical protein
MPKTTKYVRRNGAVEWEASLRGDEGPYFTQADGGTYFSRGRRNFFLGSNGWKARDCVPWPGKNALGKREEWEKVAMVLASLGES